MILLLLLLQTECFRVWCVYSVFECNGLLPDLQFDARVCHCMSLSSVLLPGLLLEAS